MIIIYKYGIIGIVMKLSLQFLPLPMNREQPCRIQIRVKLGKSLIEIEEEIYLKNKLLLQRKKAIYFYSEKKAD